MATLHLMVGLPGSGKTTEAIRLEKVYHAIRFTPDEWHLKLFGNDFDGNWPDEVHDQRHGIVEQLMWETGQKILAHGVDVILDYGFWAREERDALRAEAEKLGAEFQIHYMECPLEEIWKRLEKRNQAAGSNVFYITRKNLEEWNQVFQPPQPDELQTR